MWTPCDVVGDDGRHHCPYEGEYGGSEGSMCRDCCGLGVDENSYDYEEYPYDDE